MNNKWMLIVLVLAVVVTACQNSERPLPASSEDVLTVFKSPTCGCCKGWGEHMEDQGYAIEYVEEMGLEMRKNQLEIPHQVRSCHTTMVGPYFVEGHIPAEVVEKLLEEKPGADGIAMAGMPAGSPGMPGMKREPFIVYLIKDGEVLKEYARI